MPIETPGLSTLLEEQTKTQPSTGDGDHDLFKHLVRKDKIVESAVTGKPVVALCGKVWVPSRDPQKYPACPECMKIYERLPKGPSGDE